MLKQVLMGLCAIGIAGIGYAAGTTGSNAAVMIKVAAVAATATAPASAPATAEAAVEVKNTKCIVMPEDDASDKTVSYMGKLYHVCCPDCIKAFNKDPEKYVKALNADPATYGVKAAGK